MSASGLRKRHSASACCGLPSRWVRISEQWPSDTSSGVTGCRTYCLKTRLDYGGGIDVTYTTSNTELHEGAASYGLLVVDKLCRIHLENDGKEHRYYIPEKVMALCNGIWLPRNRKQEWIDKLYSRSVRRNRWRSGDNSVRRRFLNRQHSGARQRRRWPSPGVPLCQSRHSETLYRFICVFFGLFTIKLSADVWLSRRILFRTYIFLLKKSH